MFTMSSWIVTVFRFSDPVNYFYTFYPSLLDEYDLGEDLDCVNARIDDICHDIDKDKRRVVLVWDNRRYHCIAQHPRMQPAIATPVRDILQASSVAAVGVVAGSGDSNVAARRSVA